MKGEKMGHRERHTPGLNQPELEVPVMPQEQNTVCICGDLACTIPYGLCHCGCGGQAPCPPYSHNKRGWKKDRPLKWIHGHHRTKPRLSTRDMGHFKIDGTYCRLIAITLGMYVIVWESDYEYLMQWKWYAKFSECTKSYYAGRNLPRENGKQRRISMHRQLMGMDAGDPHKADHNNGCSMDNRRDNLRPADKFQNAQNVKRNVRNTSGYKCIDWCERREMWQLRITVRGKRHHFGYFKTRKEAYAVYCVEVKRLHGDFARVA